MLSCQSEELLALAVSVVEQQAKDLRIDAARGAEDGGHEADAAIISIIRLVLGNFVPGSFLMAASCNGLLMWAG